MQMAAKDEDEALLGTAVLQLPCKTGQYYSRIVEGGGRGGEEKAEAERERFA